MEAVVSERQQADAQQQQRRRSDVYSRLYDPKSYTGVYRKRFELDCHDISEHNVHSLSNMMRTNLNYDVDPRTKRAQYVHPRFGADPTLQTVVTDGCMFLYDCFSSPRVSIAVAGVTPPPGASDEVPASSPTQRSAPMVQVSPEKFKGDPNDPHTLLKAVFHYYCRFGRTGARGVGEKTMDNANFSKLCRDCPGLLDATFTKTDVDLIFVKAKKKGERRINYARFLDALGMIAIQKFGEMPLEQSVPRVLEAHIAQLPCVLEFTDGKVVQAVWQKRAERDDGTVPNGDLPSPPPSPPKSVERGKSAASRLFPGPGAISDAPSMMPPPAPVDAASVTS